jgi:hypothetical protein
MGEWVKIIHPETQGVAEVHQGALPHHYAAGWRLLTEDEEAAQDAPEPDPDPVTREQAAELAAGTTKGKK